MSAGADSIINTDHRNEKVSAGADTVNKYRNPLEATKC